MGKFSHLPGQEKCEFCDTDNAVIGSTTVAAGTNSKSGCICPATKYKSQKTNDGNFKCIDTPSGVNSTFVGLNLTNLALEPGFYRVSRQSTDILECQNAITCAGGRGVGEHLCAEGAGGKLCSVCDDGYAQSIGLGEEKTCVKCATATIIVLSLIFALILLFFSVYIWRAFHEGGTELDEDENENEGDTPPARNSRMFSVESMKSTANRTYERFQKALPVIKILVAYFQIVSNFSFVFDMKFPPFFTNLMGIFEPLANLDIIKFVPLECIFRSNFDHKMVVQTALPVMIGGIMLLRHYLLKPINPTEKEKKTAAYNKRVKFRNWIFGTFLLGTFAVLPSVTLTIASTFSCREFDVEDEDEARWLKADYSINCSSLNHKFYELFAGLAALIYPLGIPLFYAWKLYAARKELNPGVGQTKLVNTKCVRYVKSEEFDDKGGTSVKYGYVVGNTGAESDKKVAGVLKAALVEHKDQMAEIIRLDANGAAELSIFLRTEIERVNPGVKGLSFLYSSYEPRCWWFEIFETVRRLVLTAGVSFLDSGTGANILFSIILCLGSMRIYSGYKPFVDEKLDRLAELMQWQLIFTMVAALAMKTNLAEESEQNQRYFDVLLVLIQFGSAIVIAVWALGDRLKTGKLDRALKRQNSSNIEIEIEMARLEKEGSDIPNQVAEEIKEKKYESFLATRGAAEATLGGEIENDFKKKGREIGAIHPAAEATLGGEIESDFKKKGREIEMETETKKKVKRQTLLKRRNDEQV